MPSKIGTNLKIINKLKIAEGRDIFHYYRNKTKIKFWNNIWIGLCFISSSELNNFMINQCDVTVTQMWRECWPCDQAMTLTGDTGDEMIGAVGQQTLHYSDVTHVTAPHLTCSHPDHSPFCSPSANNNIWPPPSPCNSPGSSQNSSDSAGNKSRWVWSWQPPAISFELFSRRTARIYWR